MVGPDVSYQAILMVESELADELKKSESMMNCSFSRLILCSSQGFEKTFSPVG